MSDINANATVTLTVNGKQAQNMLEQLKRQASDLEDKITKAAAAGDKVQLKKFQRELKQTRRQIGQIESATQGVENVMKRLDKASPKELATRLIDSVVPRVKMTSWAWAALIKRATFSRAASYMSVARTASVWPPRCTLLLVCA